MLWITVPFLVLIFVVIWVLRRRRKGGPVVPKSIVVDGSNVMYWGGDPSEVVLKAVINDLRAQGLSPIVVFDANAGYKLRNHFLDEAGLARLCGLRAQSVILMDSGIVADKRILEIAKKSGLRVVSNDQYRDWTVKFPFVRKKGRILRGTYKSGAVKWASKI